MENTLVFLDAGFLSKLSKHFGKGRYLTYDIIKFSKYISKKQNLCYKKIFYYTAPPFISSKPSKKEIHRKKSYDNFISKLSKNKYIVNKYILLSKKDFISCLLKKSKNLK